MRLSDKQRLAECLRSYLDGLHNTETFCAAFENLYIFEIDHAALNGEEAEALQILMTGVAFYSPRDSGASTAPGNRMNERDIRTHAHVLDGILNARARPAGIFWKARVRRFPSRTRTRGG